MPFGFKPTRIEQVDLFLFCSAAYSNKVYKITLRHFQVLFLKYINLN